MARSEVASSTSGEIQCRRRVNNGHDRCPWRGTRDEFPAHTAETRESGDAHNPCIVCRSPLADDEPRACHHCVTQAAEDLAEILLDYACLPASVEGTSFHPGTLPGGTALVMLADGSMSSPQTPNAYTEPRDVAPTVHVEHLTLIGEDITHPAFVEERIPSDGREHVRDHWPTDPVSVLAALEAHDRDWRRTFGHDPAVDLATVSGCIDYLNTWLWLAARTHDAFDDFAHEIHQLRRRLERVTGLANDPMVAPVECFDCGGRLERHYEDKRGLTDEWACARCELTYDQASYFLALRSNVLDSREWVAISAAAHATDQPVQRVRNWADRLQVGSACRVFERVTVVWWPDVLRRSGRREINQQEAS